MSAVIRKLKSFLSNQKQETFKSFSPQHDRDVTPLKVTFTKTKGDLDAGEVTERGVIEKIKTKLERSKSKSENHKRPLLSNNHVKRSKSLSHARESPKHIAPIYRSSDGKFRLSDYRDQSSVERRTRRVKSCRHHVESDSEDARRFVMRRDLEIRRNRPASDSFIQRDFDIRACRYWSPHPGSIVEEQEEEEETTFEIDCSHSNIQVRYVAHEVEQGSCASLPRQQQFPNRRMTSYTSEPTLPSRVTSSRDVIDPFVPTAAEYVYLHDLGITRPETPVGETPDPIPYVDPMSTHNPTPADPPRSKYHAHSTLPGGHYHLTPRGSLAEQTPPMPANFSVPNLHHWRSNVYPADAKGNPAGLRSAGRPLLHAPAPGSRGRVDPYSASMERQKKFGLTLPAVLERSPHKQNTEEFLSSSQHLSGQRNNNNSIQVAHHQEKRGFRTHSFSLPSLANPRHKSESRRTFDRRSFSEEVLAKSDTDLNRRCSFTSGSNSTVRHVQSKDSILSAVGSNRKSEDIKAAPPAQGRDVRSLQLQEQSPRSEKSGMSLSPPPTSGDTGAGSTSGYDSQNTSSDTSLNDVIKSRGSRYKYHFMGGGITHHNGHVHNSRSDFHDHGQSITSFGPVINIPNSSRIRASTASSNESRSRKDNSSVDEKYEWDSEYAMESEILEALKNFECHKRDGPVSKDLLQELRKLSVDDSVLSPLDGDISYRVDRDVDLSPNSSQDISANNVPLSPSQQEYTKEKMEKRCAALKEEYLEYQRRFVSNCDDSVLPGSPC